MDSKDQNQLLSIHRCRSYRVGFTVGQPVQHLIDTLAPTGGE